LSEKSNGCKGTGTSLPYALNPAFSEGKGQQLKSSYEAALEAALKPPKANRQKI
jgi:hypothetical protein